MTDSGGLRPGQPLGRALRVVLAFVGMVLLGLATYAVVFKGSEVGAVGIAGAGLLLLMIGAGGRLPTKLQVGDKLGAEFAAYRQGVEEGETQGSEAVFEAAVQAATPELTASSPSDSPASGEQGAASPAEFENRILEELASTAPSVAERLTDTRQFERTVKETLDVLAKDHGWAVYPGAKVGLTTVDFLVTYEGRSVGVEARTTRPLMDESLGAGRISMFAGSHLQGLVFVVRQRTPDLSRLMFPLSSAQIGPIQLQLANTPTVPLDPSNPKAGARSLEKTLMRFLASR